MAGDPSISVRIDRLAASLRRRPLVAGAGALGLVVALGGFAMFDAFDRAAANAVPRGERIQIHLVTPPEPEIEAGPIMQVGELVDGFEYSPAPKVEQAVWIDEPWVEPEPLPMPARRPMVRVEDWRATPPPPPDQPRVVVLSREDRSYGFRDPRPDWQEARRQRRERLEASLERPETVVGAEALEAMRRGAPPSPDGEPVG